MLTDKEKNWIATQSLAIACPMANEEETAVSFVREVLEATKIFKSVSFIAVLDNVSRDNTLKLLHDYSKSDPRLLVKWAPENRNVVDAYVKGYHAALDTGAKWILEIDAGYSHKPQDFWNFIPLIPHGYDCIFGSRFCPGGSIRHRSLLRFCFSRGGTVLSNLLLGTRLSDMTCGYQLFSSKALRSIIDRGIRSIGPFFQTEMKAYSRNLKTIEVPINYSSPSREIPLSEIIDALLSLGRLFYLRIMGRF